MHVFWPTTRTGRGIVRAQAEHLDKLGVQYLVNTECGHSFFALWGGLAQIQHTAQLRADQRGAAICQVDQGGQVAGQLGLEQGPQDQVYRAGPLQPHPQVLRDSFADDLRFVVKTLVGEENFVEMTPNRNNNYCCGGGGGSLQAGFPEERLAYGKVKFDQIMATGAKYVLVPCHNCHAQMHELSEHYEGGFHVTHLWTFICLAMGMLGEDGTHLSGAGTWPSLGWKRIRKAEGGGNPFF